jgi:hypothetical protein
MSAVVAAGANRTVDGTRWMQGDEFLPTKEPARISSFDLNYHVPTFGIEAHGSLGGRSSFF